ncbi:class I SAM-dependent methyltransferase [Candidatus Woesearchaeota archaeon]|nr:class I SAM-dependent methyltransferase [Candidatus Woesearchaeota archaeon]
MPQKNLVTGNVYNLDRYERATGRSMRSVDYFQRIGKIASEFFPLRSQIPLTPAHHNVIAAVNREVALDMQEYASDGFKFLDVGGSSGGRILDIGDKLRQLKDIGLERYIVDVDTRSVDEARAKGIDARQLDLTQERFPFEDGTIDSIFSGWTFEIIPPHRHEHIVREIHRVLKPGGKFYFQDDKYGEGGKEAPHYNNVLKPRGYKPGTFFYGIFEVPPDFKPSALGSVHPTSDKDPNSKLIGEPMYGKGFSLDEIKKLADGRFGIEKTILIDWAGEIIGSDEESFRRLADDWVNFLAVLRKK